MRPIRPALARLGLLLALVVAAMVGLGAACSQRGRPRNPDVAPERAGGGGAAASAPTVRIYYLVDLDGYLEPCGCQSRPLGGIDRLARLMETERPRAPHALFVASGDLLFETPALDPRMVFQETAKAESMVRILDQMQLAAFAPGPADFARGADEWRRLVTAGHAAPLAANVAAAPGGALRSFVLRDAGGTRVAIVGVSDFRENAESNPPAGAPETTDPVAAARTAVAEARRQGARLVVVLASVPRRVARTIAGTVEGVDFVVAARQESNAPPPERIGSAYLLTATNQGKSVGILDVYLRGAGAMADASDATQAAQRARVEQRIAELRARIAEWERDPAQDRAAVAQQRERLAQLERERAALAGPAPRPASGPYFVARLEEISPDVPKSRDVERSIAQYFRAVNEHNRQAYANLRAPEPRPGQAAYVGMEACRDCHEDAFAVWERTPHSRAYHTLDVISKNFNLSCVSCHVTGYQQPGGAEVVQNEGRRDVQCESCHGPGSLHVEARNVAQRRATIRRDVPGTFCATQCHTPEHSDHFDYAVYRPRILGPGHGYPVDSDGGGVQMDAAVLVGGHTPPNTDLSTSDGGAPADAARPQGAQGPQGAHGAQQGAAH